jgi:myo-inositol-1(or 4)-monophosphatase
MTADDEIVMMNEPDVDIDLVKEWAGQAGSIALRYFNRVEGRCKEDRTLVTDADREIEELLAGHVRTTYPSHGIVAEEGTRESGDECLWAIDPLDGTRAFLAGLPIWGISIGLIWRWQPWLGVVYIPLLDDWYHTVSPTSGAFWNDRPILCPPAETWDENSLLCTPADAHLRYEIRFPGTVRALGSAAAHLCYVARGTALTALLDNPGIWDIAAGAAILQSAGGVLRYLDGGAVDVKAMIEEGRSHRAILAAHPLVIDRLAPLIRARNSP